MNFSVKKIPYRDFIIEMMELGRNYWQSSVYDTVTRYDHGTICDGAEYNQARRMAEEYINNMIWDEC